MGKVSGNQELLLILFRQLDAVLFAVRDAIPLQLILCVRERSRGTDMATEPNSL